MTRRMIVELTIIAFLFAVVPLLFGQEKYKATALDRKVQAFLDSQRGRWRDMNVPEVDGKLLYDIIIKNRYTKRLRSVPPLGILQSGLPGP
ncbi:MAG: hypothetical protein AB1473_04040 [Thermodesulfobacteriota bacterium]